MNPSDMTNFIVTTPGLSATRWLSFVFTLHEEVFVAHGKHSLDSVINSNVERERKLGDIESLTLGNKMVAFYNEMPVSQVYNEFRDIMPEAKAYGTVHAYTLGALSNKLSQETWADFKIINLLRHPINFIDSHYHLVRSAEEHPAIYAQYETMFTKTLGDFPELYLMDAPDKKRFLAYAISCHTVANMALDFEVAKQRNIQHVRMEEATQNVSKLKSMCEHLTNLVYDETLITEAIENGPINRHRKKNAATDPQAIFDTWERWQQDILYLIMPHSLKISFENVGYDVSMLGKVSDKPRDPSHNYFAAFRQPPAEKFLEPPHLLLSDVYGFNLVKFENLIYGIAQELGSIDLLELTAKQLSQYVSSNKIIEGSSIDELLFLIKEKQRLPLQKNLRVHKVSPRNNVKVSLILLDWSVREHLQALHYLQQQTVQREQYELIWIDLYDRKPERALSDADIVLTLSQRGKYHKHKGYNAGVLYASGEIICVCDSDAVFPRNFIESILQSFKMEGGNPAIPLVLMHHQLRTDQEYPTEHHPTFEEIEHTEWRPLMENVGACLSVRKQDAIRFGGFDEHRNYRGYMCGPYDLGWRLVNAGIPEIWHDPSVILWHFAHPDPLGTANKYTSLKLWLETVNLHVEGHALPAVEHFSTGRVLPLKENEDIFRLRMQERQIGSELEKHYANYTARDGFTHLDRFRVALSNLKSIRRVRAFYYLSLFFKPVIIILTIFRSLVEKSDNPYVKHAALLERWRVSRVLGLLGLTLLRIPPKAPDSLFIVGYYKRHKLVKWRQDIYISSVRPWLTEDDYLNGSDNFQKALTVEDAIRRVDKQDA